MFSLARIEGLAGLASEGLAKLNTRVLKMLGKRIAWARKQSGFDRYVVLNEADREAEKLYNEILKALRNACGDAEEIYTKAAQSAYKSLNKYYVAKGLEQLPFEYQVALVNFVRGMAAVTQGNLVNISGTRALGYRVLDLDGNVRYRGFKEHYHELVDQAITEVATGQADYSSAIRRAMRQTADSGIRFVDYASGYSRRLDSTMYQNVLDGVKAIAYEISEQTGKEIGADGIEIDAHNYCAPDHLPYQGKQFSNEEFEKIQQRLKRPFGAWNCRHTVYPVLLGISPPAYSDAELSKMAEQSTAQHEFEGNTYTAYEATQVQRRIEAEIRKSKERAVLAQAAEDDLLRKVEQQRINQLRDKYTDLCKVFGLLNASDRMRVSGFIPFR
jgi:hypothetical protein